MLSEAAAEINSGVISADSVFGSLASIGCDWDAVVVAHMDEVSSSWVAVRRSCSSPDRGKNCRCGLPVRAVGR